MVMLADSALYKEKYTDYEATQIVILKYKIYVKAQNPKIWYLIARKLTNCYNQVLLPYNIFFNRK